MEDQSATHTLVRRPRSSVDRASVFLNRASAASPVGGTTERDVPAQRKSRERWVRPTPEILEHQATRFVTPSAERSTLRWRRSVPQQTAVAVPHPHRTDHVDQAVLVLQVQERDPGCGGGALPVGDQAPPQPGRGYAVPTKSAPLVRPRQTVVVNGWSSIETHQQVGGEHLVTGGIREQRRLHRRDGSDQEELRGRPPLTRPPRRLDTFERPRRSRPPAASRWAVGGGPGRACPGTGRRVRRCVDDAPGHRRPGVGSVPSRTERPVTTVRGRGVPGSPDRTRMRLEPLQARIPSRGGRILGRIHRFQRRTGRGARRRRTCTPCRRASAIQTGRRIQPHRLGQQQPRQERGRVMQLDPGAGVHQQREQERVRLRETEVRRTPGSSRRSRRPPHRSHPHTAIRCSRIDSIHSEPRFVRGCTTAPSACSACSSR